MPRCLIIMAKAPIVGLAKTRLSAGVGAERAVALYRCFLEDAVALARQIPGCRPAFSFSPAEAASLFAALCPDALLLPQCPGNLGDRLLDAAAQAAALGYDEIALLAGDTPGIPAHVVEGAFAALATSPAALGPAEDGGYYLIGMREPQPALFRPGIAWGGPEVAAQTYAAAEAAGLDMATLPTWYDIDTAADLPRLHADLRAGRARAPATYAALEAMFGGG
ncbi:TIGR04282 family arsenosugar biosynthesis glycosyltransferase [Oscillochloris sp. ZM17-4]|uniref:TIGR04282 family arsenosugar biosynthesis glycosyltransferase n=1 Tax=Oscillochloris sp. ZM17-4 TaxID=2866714 RepID=UPI001C736F79|nr:TIGR04282 family arsenosugar biosynthesis glycosyltransferase [Oscillochloris sp. ZM17-4]MBX0326125.1 TIGR04282 family arsenosugar biosynthesis glycosyltransferase [Oscillochloris sp. ZM17-4]